MTGEILNPSPRRKQCPATAAADLVSAVAQDRKGLGLQGLSRVRGVPLVHRLVRFVILLREHGLKAAKSR